MCIATDKEKYKQGSTKRPAFLKGCHAAMKGEYPAIGDAMQQWKGNVMLLSKEDATWNKETWPLNKYYISF